MENLNTTGAFRIGPIRPPSEADSLLIQITNGCTWNKCKFCQLYRHTKFKAYTVDSILEDIDRIVAMVEEVEKFHQAGSWDLDGLNQRLGEMAGEEQQCFYMVATWYIGGGEKVFLQDGNSVVLSGGKLSTVLAYLKEKLPTVKRITSYGRAENLSRLAPENFVELHEAGLDCIHSGFESGSDAVLKMVNKGVTSEQQILAGKMIRAAGIEMSVYFMPGLGGHELSQENARGITEVVNACEPNVVRIRTAAVKAGTEWNEDLRDGKFTLASDDEKVREIRYLVEHGDFDGRIVSDHMINLLDHVQGDCRKDREKMLEMLDEYLNMPEAERKMYQLARRMVRVDAPSQMSHFTASEMEYLKSEVARYDEKGWNQKMNDMISRYI